MTEKLSMEAKSENTENEDRRTMMGTDFYSFINSRDVQSYLRQIGYRFSAPEAAFLVYHSESKTLEEKMSAWGEIIETFPDCSMDARATLMKIDSFHRTLADYMELQRKKIQKFYKSEGFIYSYSYHESCITPGILRDETYDGWFDDDKAFFSDYDSCLKYCQRKEAIINGEIDRLCIHKCRINPKTDEFSEINAGGNLVFNGNLDILSANTGLVYDNSFIEDLDMIFTWMCFDFPTPFKRGDILIPHYEDEVDLHCNYPFVLSYITTWKSEEMKKRGFGEHDCPSRFGWDDFDRTIDRRLERGDWSDMRAIGTFAGVPYDNEGMFFEDDILEIPTNLEYYTEPLEGYERQLQALSMYEKGEIDWEVLVNSCFAMRTETNYKKIQQEFISPYTKEIIEKLGF
ncbi:MAG: hypothetical protein LUF32_08350 [Clostridiales bacterium]|nr:hypothetical protein [Clostridiales bacterium]